MLERWQNGMGQGVELLPFVVAIVGGLAVHGGSRGFIAWLVEVGIIHQDHTLNADQHLTHSQEKGSACVTNAWTAHPKFCGCRRNVLPSR